jgi:MFS superfamily sulfate permease-like transporter
MLHLSKPDYLRNLFARDRREFAVAATVIAGELTLGVLAGLLIWRIGGGLFFANIGHMVDRLKAALAASPQSVKHVLLDADSVNFIDTSACDRLLSVIKELQNQEILVALARVRDEVREPMRLAGIEAAVGSTNFHERVTDGVRAWQREGGHSVSAGMFRQ